MDIVVKTDIEEKILPENNMEIFLKNNIKALNAEIKRLKTEQEKLRNHTNGMIKSRRMYKKILNRVSNDKV